MSTSSVSENIFTEEVYQIPSPVVVVLPCEWKDLSEGEQTTLAKMLTAVKLNLAAVQIVSRKAFSIEELAPSSPTKVLAFGSTCTSLDTKYQTLQQGEMQLILSDSLKSLTDIQKKDLWQALKKMFGI